MAYLSVQKWFVGDVPFYVKIWPKLTHPLKNPISHDIRLSDLAVTPRENKFN